METRQSTRPRFANVASRLGRLMRRWSLGPASTEKIARWEALVAHGEALERLTTSPDWAALVERKDVYLRMRDLLLHTPSASDDARRQAALEWNALDAFFREVTRSMREGQQANTALSKVTPTHDN